MFARQPRWVEALLTLRNIIGTYQKRNARTWTSAIGREADERRAPPFRPQMGDGLDRLLLLLLSVDMVFARQSGIRSTTAAETEEAEDSTDVAVFPLPIPLIAGPGAITSVILLMGQVQGDFILQTIVIALMLFVLGLCLVAFLFAIPLMDRLGVTGINVVGRVFGIVLAALAVQYVLDGVMEVLTNAPGKLPV
jgi:hypothetical protein